jgi:ABC-type Mn2+/Zn2+ transport system ATPase subunit
MEANMADDGLKSDVLQRADNDTELSEDARLVVLAALGDADDLGQVLGDDATPQSVVDSLNTAEAGTPAPVGAYLRSIAVQGFRGIGPKVTLPLTPGPGLTVVAGRNGSGKSTLAEGLELALTGSNSRWKDKTAVWSQNWRNLHTGATAEITIGFAEAGSGETSLGVEWPSGAEVELREQKRWVQRAGQKREAPEVLGWNAALEMYRPLLSYDELGSILEGRPSDFYDQLYKLLGLEQLTVATERLTDEVKRLKTPSAESKKARDALRPRLEQSDDPRARAASGQIKKTKPDLDVVRPLITDSAASIVPPAWRHAQQLIPPDTAEVGQACAALRAAAATEAAESQRTDALAADRSQLLELSLAFHDNHGVAQCPVCGEGTLNDDWAARARTALEQERGAAAALTAARDAVQLARSTLVAIARATARPPTEDAELSTIAAARQAFETFAALPLNDDVALVDHVEASLPPLQIAYGALRQEASGLIQARDVAWSPLAVELAAWLSKAEQAVATAPKLAVAAEALDWLQTNSATLRNERIAPLANQAKEIWAALRQESNVELEEIELKGRNTSRHVHLKAEVDGHGSDAFGVMSQGELQALALAIFIPRATSPASPFRFLVFDDPIQAMDPSKIDGFLDVLTALARDRQVIVFTHDDRLPAAIRRSKTPARVVELTRAANSVVTVSESSRPAKRMLDDAFAIAADAAVPDAIKSAAIPVLCREALESTAWDVFATRSLTSGRSPAEVEETWNAATTTRKRLALAIDSNDDAAMDKWLDGDSRRRATLVVATKGIHTGVSDFKAAVNAARAATRDLGRVPV